MNDPLIGELVDGHYLVHQLLGVGGMGRVYRAEQLELSREVALKTLPLARTADMEVRRERFHREAKATSRVNHPGVVQIYGYGEWRDELYIAMELIEGASLSEVVLREGPQTPARCAKLLIEACDAVHAAHAVGVLHRDLKPENIMLARAADGVERVKVVDFGLAIVMAGTDERLTQEGLVMGTPAYVSPEQARAELLDERSDVYSLGVVLFELLAGRTPFMGRTPADVVVKHCYEDPPLPSAVAPPGTEVHPSLESMALWALSKAPESRPASAADFAEELRAALELIEGGRIDPHRNRKAPLPGGDRLSRGAALGLEAPPTSPGAPTLPRRRVGNSGPPVLVCPAPHDEDGDDDLTIGLRAGGLSAVRLASQSLPELMARAVEHGSLVAVVDLRPNPAQRLAALAGLDENRLAIVGVGPDGDMELMTRALEQGLADFVPVSLVPGKLARRVSKLLKRRLRRGR